MSTYRDPKTGRYATPPAAFDSTLRTLSLKFGKGLALYNAIAKKFAGMPGVTFSELYARSQYISNLGSLLSGASGSYKPTLKSIPFRNRRIGKAMAGSRIHYTVRTAFTDPSNGVTYNRYFIVGSNSKLTIDQIKLQAMTQLMGYLQNSPTFDAAGQEVAPGNYSIDVVYASKGY